MREFLKREPELKVMVGAKQRERCRLRISSDDFGLCSKNNVIGVIMTKPKEFDDAEGPKRGR